MTKAAKNIANDTTSTTSTIGTNTKKMNTKFSHLHILFRDWQSVGTDSDAVYKQLFDLEHTTESESRDRI